MQITHEQRGNYLLVKAAGKLDVTWADHFTTTLLTHIRHGHHQILVDASEMSFLSSAGIRSLMTVYKEILTVQGSFQIVEATEFVNRTLETSGFQMWIANVLPVDFPLANIDAGKTNASTKEDFNVEVFVLNEKATLELSVPASWQPWQKVDKTGIVKLNFPKSVFALGIGSAADTQEEARLLLGEFLAITGNVVYQPPDVDGRPDYLLAEEDFVPQLQIIQALVCSGEMSHLVRFSPTITKSTIPLSGIAEMALNQTRSDAAAFVVLAEIDGLVGAGLIKSPGLIENERPLAYPEIREWLSFCGERVYANHQAILFGLVKKNHDNRHTKLLSISSTGTIYMHAHAAVFPYQSLQNGNIDLMVSIEKFFKGTPPLALLHLVDDTRPAAGLGQSTFIRGACWCSPIKNPEVIL